MGAINFGMLDGGDAGETPHDVVLAVGILTVANAAFNCFVLCTHPAFKVKPVPQVELNNDVSSGDHMGHRELSMNCNCWLYGRYPGT